MRESPGRAACLQPTSRRCGAAAAGGAELPHTRRLPAPYTYRTARANVRTGASIRDAFGSPLGTVNDTNPKEFHVFERIAAVVGGRRTELYWLRGAYTREPVSGFVAREDIENAAALAAEADSRAANGNGAPSPVTAAGRLRLRPISDEMGYPGPSDGRCRQYRWYGVRGMEPAGSAYAYLVWSLPNVRGGGMNRTIIRDREEVRYPDTRVVRTTAYRYVPGSTACREEVGWVDWRYVRVTENGVDFYGWAVSDSYFADEGVVKHHMESPIEYR